ncbi:hypothetical protein K438DRAFT_1776420 [Mycena galopus ATCC 62051]|nr:hypothetical protein K438DRAFT_1776420 [Mycena galopus ATCC 62051]
MVDCLCKGVGMDSPKADTDASDDPHFHMLCERRTQSNEDCCWPSRFDIDGSKKFDHLTPQLTKPKWAPRSLETTLKLAISRNGRDKINASARNNRPTHPPPKGLPRWNTELIIATPSSGNRAEENTNEEGTPRQLTVVCSSYRVRQGAGNGEGHESRGNAARAQAASRGRARANPGHKKIEIKGKRRALEPVRQWNKKSGKNHSPPARSDGVANKIWLVRAGIGRPGLGDVVWVEFVHTLILVAKGGREGEENQRIEGRLPPKHIVPPRCGRCRPRVAARVRTPAASGPIVFRLYADVDESDRDGECHIAGELRRRRRRGGGPLRGNKWPRRCRAGERVASDKDSVWSTFRRHAACVPKIPPSSSRGVCQSAVMYILRSSMQAQPFQSGPGTLPIIISSTSCTVEDARGCACTGTTWASPELSSDISLAPPDISSQRTRATFMPRPVSAVARDRGARLIPVASAPREDVDECARIEGMKGLGCDVLTRLLRSRCWQARPQRNHARYFAVESRRIVAEPGLVSRTFFSLRRAYTEWGKQCGVGVVRAER